MIFIKLHPNVPLSEMVYRTHYLAMQTQSQGHTLRSWDLPLKFMAPPYYLNTLKVFIKLWLNVNLSETVY